MIKRRLGGSTFTVMSFDFPKTNRFLLPALGLALSFLHCEYSFNTILLINRLYIVWHSDLCDP